MNAEQIDQIEAGTEMDRAVAEACGIEWRNASDYLADVTNSSIVRLFEWPDGINAVKIFRPSSDWNDAMFAAEKFGLFHEAERSLQLWRIGWVVCAELPQGLRLRDRIVGCGAAGPLAICRAILKLDLHSSGGKG